MRTRKYSLSLLSANALALAAALSCLPAHALNTIATPTAGSTASANGVNGLPDTVSGTDLASSSTSANAWDVGGSWSIGWGSQYGAYGVQSSAEGIANAQSFSSLSYTITNGGASAMSYSLYFKIYGGSVGNNVAASLTGGESLSGSYDARVLVDGAVRFNSSASIQNTASGLVFSHSGVDLSRGANGAGPADNGLDGVYDWATDYYRVDLGLIGAGQSVSVLAQLSSSAAANVGTFSFECGGPQKCLAFKGSASASYGDQNNFFGSATAGLGEEQIRLVATSPVPEPSRFVLAGVGLLAIIVSRRRADRRSVDGSFVIRG